jgi:hypothetical protein
VVLSSGNDVAVMGRKGETGDGGRRLVASEPVEERGEDSQFDAGIAQLRLPTHTMEGSYFRSCASGATALANNARRL